MEGSTRKSLSYDQACRATWLYTGTNPHGWRAVPIKGFSEVDNGQGGKISLPEFNFPQGYGHAQVIFEQPGDSGDGGFCELCGHPIKRAFHIQNDEEKLTMVIGSECVTNFGSGESGQTMEKRARATANRDLLRQAWESWNRLTKRFGSPVGRDSDQHRIHNQDEIYWALRRTAGLRDSTRDNPHNAEEKARAEKIQGQARAIWTTFRALSDTLMNSSGAPVLADDGEFHESRWRQSAGYGGQGSWHVIRSKYEAASVGTVTRWVKRHADTVRKLLDDVDLIFGDDQREKLDPEGPERHAAALAQGFWLAQDLMEAI